MIPYRSRLGWFSGEIEIPENVLAARLKYSRRASRINSERVRCSRTLTSSSSVTISGGNEIERVDVVRDMSRTLISSPNSSLHIAMNSSRSGSGIRWYFGNIPGEAVRRETVMHRLAVMPRRRMLVREHRHSAFLDPAGVFAQLHLDDGVEATPLYTKGMHDHERLGSCTTSMMTTRLRTRSVYSNSVCGRSRLWRTGDLVARLFRGSL